MAWGCAGLLQTFGDVPSDEDADGTDASDDAETNAATGDVDEDNDANDVPPTQSLGT